MISAISSTDIMRIMVAMTTRSAMPGMVLSTSVAVRITVSTVPGK